MSTRQTDLWVYPAPAGSTADITGYKVEAIDGSIGKIDQATYETDASYVVVDTGPWIFGTKVVPGGGHRPRRSERGDGLRQSHEGRDQERARVRRQPLRQVVPRQARDVLRPGRPGQAGPPGPVERPGTVAWPGR